MNVESFIYGVPKSTFYDRITGKVAGDKRGPVLFI